jgi:hypothetical protein
MGDQSMLDGVVMNVIEVSIKILNIFESMFPKPGLPNSSASFTPFGGGGV